MTLLETINRQIEEHGGREAVMVAIQEEYNRGNLLNNYNYSPPEKILYNTLTNYQRVKLRHFKQCQ